MSKTGYVYTLNDPRTGEPKYVGATKNPGHRLAGHKSDPTNSDVSDWIDELTSEGESPELTVVRVTDLDRLDKEELEVMDELSEKWDLFNKRQSRYHSPTGEGIRLVSKNLYLPLDVVERLEEEGNQSVVVEGLLRERYDL